MLHSPRLGSSGLPGSPAMAAASSGSVAWERQNTQKKARVSAKRSMLAKGVQNAFLDRLGRISLHEAFSAMDLDANGTLSADELKKGLHALRIGVAPWELGEIMSCIDSDGSGTISRAEFLGMFTKDHESRASQSTPPPRAEYGTSSGYDPPESPYPSPVLSSYGDIQLPEAFPRLSDHVLVDRLGAVGELCDQCAPVVDPVLLQRSGSMLTDVNSMAAVLLAGVQLLIEQVPKRCLLGRVQII